ncbi:MAG: prepilin-type N-terminal cleavage/methylation domain-containing protein [Gemmatimonadota bacterium]
MRRRNGFTLVEVLVVVAILAVLSAVLIPTILNQIRKGQIGRVTGDLDAARAAIEAFAADVQRFPGDLEDLTTQIQASPTDLDINGVGYPTGLRSKWDGPYMNKVLEAGILPTGFGGKIQDDLDPVLQANGVNYVTIEVLGIAEADFNDIDVTIDGTANSSTGQLRWTAANDGTITYLAVPIN